MYFVEVGKPYGGVQKQWPERGNYVYRGETHELLLFLTSPTPPEIRAVSEERAAFALATYMDLIFLCYRFGDMAWSDSVYSYHLVRPEEQMIPEIHESEEARSLLNITLIDARGGIVKGLRTVSLSPAFTRSLHEAIRAQADRPWPGQEEYDRQIARVYAGHTPAQIAQKLAKVRCVGGE